MDVMRAFQGLGPAAFIPAALGILAQSFERGSTIRTIAFATFSSGAPIGGAFGGTMGGVLTQLSKYVYFLYFGSHLGMPSLIQAV
jgi:MFS family permease